MKSTMKNFLSGLAALFFCGLLIQAGCSKDDEVIVAPPPNADQFITWKIGNTQGYLASPSDTLWTTTSFGPTVIFGNTPNLSSTVYASFNGTAAGIFPSYVNIFTGGKYYVSGNTASQLSITSFGSVGGYVTGSYSGTLKDSTGTATFSAAGTFKIKRR
jgi:hypothetical protein